MNSHEYNYTHALVYTPYKKHKPHTYAYMNIHIHTYYIYTCIYLTYIFKYTHYAHVHPFMHTSIQIHPCTHPTHTNNSCTQHNKRTHTNSTTHKYTHIYTLLHMCPQQLLMRTHTNCTERGERTHSHEETSGTPMEAPAERAEAAENVDG